MTSSLVPDIKEKVVLELNVRSHPGVMSHVCGLFARRAFNVEGLLCMPVGEGVDSRIWLLVREDERLPPTREKKWRIVSKDRRSEPLPRVRCV